MEKTKKIMNQINRKGKQCIFSKILKKNLTLYLFDFLSYYDLSRICNANIFLCNCFNLYQSSWKNELKKLQQIFNLDIPPDKIDENLEKSIEKKRVYRMKDNKGIFIKFTKEGLNIFSLIYYENWVKTKSRNWSIQKPLNTYFNGNCLYLESPCGIDISFSFNHIIKSNYKLFIHHSFINMKNAQLECNIFIDNKIIKTIYNFPTEDMLERGTNGDDENTSSLIEEFLCDINENMFDLRKKDYCIKVTFTNKDLFWKAGWFIDGGKLISNLYQLD